MSQLTRTGLKAHKAVMEAWAKGFAVETKNAVTGAWTTDWNPVFSADVQHRVVMPRYLRVAKGVSWATGMEGKVVKVEREAPRATTPFGDSVLVKSKHLLHTKLPTLLSFANSVPATKTEWTTEFPKVDVCMDEIAAMLDVPVESLSISL